MKKYLYFIFICANGFSQINVVEMFESLYSDNSVKIENTYKDAYNIFCDQHEFDKNNDHNKDIFYRLYFMHKLFTTDSAIDCRATGILEIPYFWDDTREYIEGNEENKRRTPKRFLSDLVTDKPQYSYGRCGEFYTFGWCAEREMSFVALLRNMGLEADIIAADGHAWAQVYVTMYTNDYESMYSITIDNTFNEFYIGEYNFSCIHDCEEYDYNCSTCLMIEYYNPRANDKITNIIVSESSHDRINKLVLTNLK